MSRSTTGDWYVWHWEAGEDMWGAPVPPWELQCVTDCWYAPESLLKRHLDTLTGQERTAEDWRLAGLGRLVGRAYWVTIRNGLHTIVPRQGDFWTTCPDPITQAGGNYVDSTPMRAQDAGLVNAWIQATRPKMTAVPEQWERWGWRKKFFVGCAGFPRKAR